MNGTLFGSVIQNTVHSLKVFLQDMTTSIQSLAIRQNGVQFSHADNHAAFTTSQESRMCLNSWHHGDSDMLNGYLRHHNPPFPERCRYASQELMVPQIDCNRLSSADSNESCFEHVNHGLYGAQGLAVNNTMGNGVISKQFPRTWHAEKPLYPQAYQGFVDEIKKTVQTWSVKHHSLVQASHLVNKNSSTPHASRMATSCVEPSWESVLQSCSHTQEQDVPAGHTVEETLCSTSMHASEGGTENSSVATASFTKNPQSYEPACMFTRSTRRRSLYRRRALKKIANFNADTTEDRVQSSPININQSIGSSSTSHGLGPIVESPNWLPQGWITEMKTRASGTSAGCKYKCYVDPVTKRRFRTRKEVFCFLATGNTGRYKPKFKMQQNDDSLQSDSDCTIRPPISGLRNLLQGPNLADGYQANRASFLDRSWQYRTGRSAYGGLVNIQAAALKLLTDDDDMTLEEKSRLFARFSPQPVNLYGLRLPVKNFKRPKLQGKEGLEALGKVICQQGLSILRKGND